MPGDEERNLLSTNVRASGLRKMAIGALGLMISLYILFKGIIANGIEVPHPITIAFSLPGAYALIGVLEMVTNTPYLEIVKKWSALKSWQRAIVITIVTISSFFVTGYGVYAYYHFVLGQSF
jgi:hypothetical protein